jgi:hypothetical protein
LLGVVRSGGAPWSLANAFLKPVRPRHGEHDPDLLGESAARLDAHLGALLKMYGDAGIDRIAWCALDGVPALPTLQQVESPLHAKVTAVPTVDAFVAALSAPAAGA